MSGKPYRPPPLRTVTDYIRDCDDRYLVTLTSKRSLGSEAMSREVGETLHRVNAKLFGNAYSRRKTVRLATYAVQEQTERSGLHTHMLVGVPNGTLNLKSNPCRVPVPDLIVSTWVGLDERGMRRANAQDARPIFDLTVAISYVHKDIWRIDDFDAVDVLNTHAPSTPSCPG